MSETCSYCGEKHLDRWHTCALSPNVEEAIRRQSENLRLYCDLSDPFDYDISLILAEVETLTRRVGELEAGLERLLSALEVEAKANTEVDRLHPQDDWDLYTRRREVAVDAMTAASEAARHAHALLASGGKAE